MTTAPESTTLVELLAARAATTPDQARFQFLGDGEQLTATLTFAQVDRAARALAARLAEIAAPGDRALLLYAPGLDFVTAFYGCLYAGVIAIPVAPPQPSKLQAGLERLAAITGNSGARLLLTTADLEPLLAPALQLDGLSALRTFATDTVDPAEAESYRAPEIRGDSVAYLQYSSGSTGEPKGVVLTHRNVLANLRLITQHATADEHSVGVSWLPTYHDMGLLIAVTQPVYSNSLVVGMSPLAFVQQPVRWIAALSRFGATHTVAPNFAFSLAVRRVSAERVAEFDLSRLRVALCGAEPIRAETLTAFTDHFRPAGLDPAALFPCYGLAEATLFVSGGPVGNGLTTLEVDSAALLRDRVEPTSDGRALVASGALNDGFELVLVDPDTLTPVPAGRVGEIFLRGDSIGLGYWAAPETSAATFAAEIPGRTGHFLRTGDLGFVHDNRLYITGRRKDLIIVDGYNHYPTDLEATAVRSHRAIRPDRCAAFQLDGEDRPRLALVAELDREWTPTAGLDEVATTVRRAVGEQHGLRLDDVVLVAAGSVPLTSSGKVRRFAVRDQYRDGALTALR
ncbi:fatty acyl-AMP ligase [Nocardia pseudobrasiliensis]|uniref:Acyl-CoA synthetase (AMP-forming)/AMP-acid ligase II n=1 Tax=Nocardia pseudobrasiliensis TaxID=45979 RepID=A0A370HPS6_9NOCA|nr:fatty acyl-AMP ligase [Nocardia pseudobrasiliensis]RDI60310.1 acyl-CoA synthetase (AMP-forming)/AMP-acid ligase II [Nocardia pseudobrasiliensis]